VRAARGGDARARMGIAGGALRGRSLRALGQPEVCVRALAPWMAASEQQSSEQPRAVSEFLSQLGRCHRQLGGLDVARDLFGKALALRSGLADSKALQAESQTDLAGLLADEGRHAQAITAIRDALTLLRESGGDRNALGVEIWRDLGSLHRMVGDTLESEASYRQSLEIALNRFGPSHPATTSVQRPLGAMLIEAGKLTEAERLLRQAHERLLARFGPEHAEVAASWQTLGQLALEQGQLAQAQDALQRSLQLRRRSNELGARGSVLCDLARTRLALAQAESAELLAHECQQQALAFDPVQAARSERLLAEVARVQGNPQAAAALLASAKRRLLAAGIDPTSRALALVDLAKVRLLIDGGDLVQARAALDALQARPRRRSVESDDVAWRTDALEARLLCRLGRAGEGRELAAATLAAAATRQPERQRTLDEIAEISKPCGG
ncbi:MAG: tetratricopeptide repeat protein, partial [Arenimonas sp.]|uniref:tetratricopeptide repeat protein n=1 Tax=Arenimonas sp. TaxID=1872635 RepID=UPI0025B7CD25